jgi:UPF0755 protein
VATGKMLEEKNIIKSSFVFRTTLIVFGKERSILAGDYYFKKPEGVFSIARRLSGGLSGLSTKKVTIPEGISLEEIPALLRPDLVFFKADEFKTVTKGKEGYLFPDTYFFLSNADAVTVVNAMSENFDKKIDGIRLALEVFGHSLKEVVTMASILEEEARTPETRRMVSGILWKRISLDMPLQVDAAFLYINKKKSSELTLDDLKIDSPYNTYKYRGFPPTPITNPGLDSILAAIEPTKSKYLYYLSDKDGEMHYASTFEQHVQNKQKYLR